MNHEYTKNCQGVTDLWVVKIKGSSLKDLKSLFISFTILLYQ